MPEKGFKGGEAALRIVLSVSLDGACKQYLATGLVINILGCVRSYNRFHTRVFFVNYLR